MHYLAWPFLAGLQEIERTGAEDSSQWEEERIRRGVAFYYCTPHADYRPQWYRRLIETRHEIVADVQTQFAVSEFRSDREHVYKLWELAHDPGPRSGRSACQPATAPRLPGSLQAEADQRLWTTCSGPRSGMLTERCSRN